MLNPLWIIKSSETIVFELFYCVLFSMTVCDEQKMIPTLLLSLVDLIGSCC